jgi:predicted lactoylglutathione lyase
MTTQPSAKPARKVFINLPVRDLAASKAFFAKLGFEFNPQFTDDKAACMILSDEGFVMLLATPFFETFTKKKISDPRVATEAIFALSCTSREEVDALVNAAVAAGGRPVLDPKDHGFMYGWSFYDLDEHHWEVMWMDPAHVAHQ